MMSLAEAAGFALAIGMVFCSIRELHWSWPLAIASSILYFFVFQDSQLYGESALQIVFAILALWGWWQWLRSDKALAKANSEASEDTPLLHIAHLTSAHRWRMVMVSLVLWPLVSLFLQHYTDTDVPWWDGFTTSLSLVGQYLLGRKYVENWLIWIVVNGVSIGLFAYKGLWLTVLLYLIFVVMSVIGWRTWQRKIH